MSCTIRFRACIYMRWQPAAGGHRAYSGKARPFPNEGVGSSNRTCKQWCCNTCNLGRMPIYTWWLLIQGDCKVMLWEEYRCFSLRFKHRYGTQRCIYIYVQRVQCNVCIYAQTWKLCGYVWTTTLKGVGSYDELIGFLHTIKRSTLDACEGSSLR